MAPLVEESHEALDSHGSRIAAEVYQRTGRPALVLDRNGGILMANRSAVEYLDIDRKALPGINVDSFPWPEGELKKFLSMLESAIGGVEIRGVVGLGDEREVAVELLPIHGDSGAVEAAAFSLEDITERELGRNLSMALNGVYETMLAARPFDESVQRALVMSAQAMRAGGAGIALIEADRPVLRFTFGRFDTRRGEALSDNDTKKLFQTATPLPPDAIIVKRFAPRSGGGSEEGLTLVVTIPLASHGRPMGMLTYHYHWKEPVLHPIQIDFATKIGVAFSLTLEAMMVNNKGEEWRELLQGVIENSPAGIALLSLPDLSVLMANRVFFKNMQDRTGLYIAPGPVQEAIMEKIGQALDREMPQQSCELPVTQNGGTRYWNMTFVPMSDRKSVLLLAADVTPMVEERARLKELARLEEVERTRLRTILDTLPVGVLVVDSGGRTIESNPVRNRIWGGNAVEPQSLEDFGRFEGRWSDTGMAVKKEEWPAYRSIKEGVTTIGSVLDIQRKDGSYGTIIQSAAPIHGSSGELLGAVSVIQDITAQRLLEHEALEAKQKMELYLDVLSHDINNLNAAAKGYLELYKEREKTTAKGRRLLDKTGKMLEDVSGLIENIRKLQELESKGRSHSLIDLESVLEDSIDTYTNQPGRDVTISHNFTGPIMVMANELVGDMFSNLLSNSVKHSPDPVFITIRVGRTLRGGREYHRIEIEDNGPGIPNELKPKLFNRFVRGKTRAQGKGLGLYLSKKIAEEFGGDIWVEDRLPGDHTRGVRFVVLFPVVTTGATIPPLGE